MYTLIGRKAEHRAKGDYVHAITGEESQGQFTNMMDLYRHLDTKHHYFSHHQFVFEYNGNRIVSAEVNPIDPVEITYDKGDLHNIVNYYSVKWIENKDADFNTRFEKYIDKDFFEHHIHWFAMFNAFMMVIFLSGLVAMIMMRTLRSDYARYNRDEDDLDMLERDVSDESGWKLLHGDVFRPVVDLIPLSVALGASMQLVACAFMVILCAIAGTVWASRGALLMTGFVCWALTSFVNGYVSGGFYARNDGKEWIFCMIATAVSLPFFVYSIVMSVNIIGYLYAQASFSLFAGLSLVIIWSVVAFPLTLAGTIVGRNWAGSTDLPCRVKRIPSPIPKSAFFARPWFIALFGGVLPFGSIFIELYFVFTSFWSYKVYYVYGFMLLTLIILILVQSCISVVGTYFLLNSENHQWQWTAYGSGLSTGLYVMAYAYYFFYKKTTMVGIFMPIFYFAYSFLFAAGIGLSCGGIAYLASSVFVKRIYRNVKCD